MQDIGVLFLVEHVARELDVVTCLMHKLQRRHNIGSAARGYYHGSRQNLAMFKPRVVVLPFFYGADHLQPVRYVTAWPSARLVNLGWEQILNKIDIGMKIPRDDIARTGVHRICWTQEHRDFLLRNGVDDRALSLTGSPVMQMYCSPYRHYFKTRQELGSLYGLDVEKRWILFSESYQFAMFSAEHMRSLVEHQNAAPDLISAVAEYGRRSLRQLLAWVNDSIGDDGIFILRPRPSTTEDGMLEFMRQCVLHPRPNVRIIQAETARDWIPAVDHVMSSHSTTLIEAALAGKPIHRFSPEPSPSSIALEWHRLVPLLEDRTALSRAISEAAPAATGERLADWARAEFLSFGDPLDAITDRIARLHDAGHDGLSQGSRQAVVERSDLWDGEGCSQAGDIFSDDDVAVRLVRWRSVLGD
jgi:surface carbohydrate biosynthesis protein